MDRVAQSNRSRRIGRLNLSLATALALFGALPVAAAELAVTTPLDSVSANCSKEHCSLRDAILAANASGVPTTIRMPAGTYNIAISGADEDAGLTGDFDISGDVTISGAGEELTKVVILQYNDRVFDIASGARVRFENLKILSGGEYATNMPAAATPEYVPVAPPTGIRSGGFAGRGTPADTRLELSHVVLGNANSPGTAIRASGTLIVEDSVLHGSFYSPSRAVIGFDGAHLEIQRSLLIAGTLGVNSDITAGGHARIIDTTIRGSGRPQDECSALEISGATRIDIVRSQVTDGTAASYSAPTCLQAAAVSITDSTFTTSFYGFRALSVASSDTHIKNSTFDGSIRNSGNLRLTHASLGSQRFFAGSGSPFSLENLANSTAFVTNSLLIGSCTGSGIVPQGNNVEAPGDTCGLPASTNRVGQTIASLELSALALNGGTTLNWLPGGGSVLNTVFTADGLARCEKTDQRGFLRASACTIGAVEAGATEQVLFRDGFDP